MLTKLKSFLKEQKADFFLLPNSDQFFSEYLPEREKIIEYLTGFSGSNAMVIFGQEKSYFFTDGRYILQARQELDLQEFEIINMAEKSILVWLQENLTDEKKLALDPKLMGIKFIKYCENFGAELLLLKSNPIDKIWQNRPLPTDSAAFFCNKEAIGIDSISKRQEIIQKIDADALIITKPENICWLLNIRAADVESTPLLLAYAILFKNGEVELFIDSKRVKDLDHPDLQKVTLTQPRYFDLRIAVLRKNLQKVQIDASSTNYWLYDIFIKNDFEIIIQDDPIEIAKSCKNPVEIAGAIKSHEIDGLAVTKFLFWLENSLKNGEKIDEINASDQLLKFRQEGEGFLYPSFDSISGFASNGAIIHYHASEKTKKTITTDSLYLVDSGGQYLAKDFCGTTDITRTIAIGTPTPKMIENFTRVLKGHIALARAKFPRGTSGAQLDVLAREHLWHAGLDYQHGTGHGVGSFLSVHEGPCGISKRSHQVLLEGMIISNEPGFYEEGEYGIRIENLMLVERFDDNFLQFRSLTLAPIDHNLIDFKMMTYPEKKWLSNYHQEILNKFETHLSEENKNWLLMNNKHF